MQEPDFASEKLFFGAPAPILVPYDDPVDTLSKGEDDVMDDEEHDQRDNPFLGNSANKRPAVEEVLPGRRHKRYKMGARIRGGYAPTFKPITVELDKEDQLIVDMKQQGYKDEDIAERLVEKGFTRYETGSIACRWSRIRKKTQEYEEKLLDEQLTDWHIGEDDLLKEADELAVQKYEAELEKLEQKRWTWTAEELNKRVPRARFSAKACRERYEAIANGTARCPPELDPDPEGRRLEREQRLADYKQRKEEEAQLEAAEAAEKKRAKKNDSAAKIAARERKAAQIQLRAQKQLEKSEYRRAKADVATVARQSKQAALDAARKLRVYQMAKHQFFTRLHKQLEKEVAILRRKKEKNGGVTPEPEVEIRPAVLPRSRYLYKNTAHEIQHQDMTEAERAIEARAHEFAGIVQAVGEIAPTNVPSTKRATSDVNVKQKAHNSTDIFPEDPRAMCTIDELHDILRSRGMLLNRMKENKTIIMSRLNNEDNTISIQDLRDLLDVRKEGTTGDRAVLMRRLAVSDAKASRKYQTKYMPRPLDENGNRTRVKKPVKPAVVKTTKKYNARQVAIKNGKAVAVEDNKLKKKAPAKENESTKGVRRLNSSKSFIPEDDDEEDEDEPNNTKDINEDDMEDIVSRMLSQT